MTKAREIAELGQKLTVDGSGNLDIAGTVEANNIQVEGASGGLINLYRSSANASFDAITFKDTTNTNTNAKIGWNANELRLEGTNIIRLVSGGNASAIFGSNGDLSLYKNDGSTVGFTFDASTGKVGINNANPAYGTLHIFDDNTDRDMDANGGGQLHIDGNGYAFGIALNASGAQLYTNSASRDLIFGTNETERMRIDGNGVVAITSSTTDVVKITTESTTVGPNLLFRNTDGTLARLASAETNSLRIETGTTNKEMVRFVEANGTVFNETGVDLDFRVESNSNSHMLFVDASANNVGIGLSSPTAAGLEIRTDVNNTYSDTIPYQTHTGDSLVIYNNASDSSDDYVSINMLARGAQTSAMRHIVTTPSGGDTDYIWQFRDSADTVNTTKRMIYTSDGSQRYYPLTGTTTVFNEDGVDHDFRIESDSLTTMFFVDAAQNEVGIGTNDPNAMLGVYQYGGKTAMRLATETNEEAVTFRMQSKDGSSVTRYADIKFDALGGNERLRFQAPYNTSSPQLELSSTYGAVFNEGGADRDFRVESDSNANMLFVDASANLVGVGTNSPSTPSGTAITVYDSSVPRINFKNGTTGIGSTDGGEILMSGNQMYVQNRENDSLFLTTNAVTRVTVGTAETAINDNSNNYDFRVESNNRTSAIFVDGEKDTVHIAGQGLNTTALYVNGGISKGTANNDPELSGNITNGSHLSNQNGGSIEAVYGFSGTGRSGSKFIIEYAKYTWAAYRFDIEISSTRGLARVSVGGYNNVSDQNDTYTDDSSNMITSVVVDRTSTTTTGQGTRVTITMSGSDVHPMMTVKYSQTGGDSQPRADRLFVSTVY